jgi:hypothetical protein
VTKERQRRTLALSCGVAKEENIGISNIEPFLPV